MYTLLPEGLLRLLAYDCRQQSGASAAHSCSAICQRRQALAAKRDARGFSMVL